ncbi:rRNA maturation RNase YbeY [Reichenbachiella sp. MALMAid0571]|uniref:rRNA maturation RNase YbeY n=1 Tax=Reichenbachiella sp. MALMAid0571 TaxID=3143939 RepID=UPI0032DF003C
MSKIQFFNEDISFVLPNTKSISAWLQNTIKEEGHHLTSLNYIFCSDEYLHKINIEYLDHDYYTDIITFDNSEYETSIEGDLFISIDRVTENAENQFISFSEELHRVMVHGVLHLLGYKDKTEAQKMKIREKENAYLSLLKN